MKKTEFPSIALAILILTIVIGFGFLIKNQFENFVISLAFSTIVIIISVMAKKITAHALDADIEHEIWEISTLTFKKVKQFKKPIPAGIILPIFLSLVTLGLFKFMALLTYETRALKYRSAKRFGYYSYAEMTDWHNGLIGAAGIFFILLLSLTSYLLPSTNLEYLAKISAYYSFWNLLPISKLDGSQIFFGSRILWTILFTTATIFSLFALTII